MKTNRSNAVNWLLSFMLLISSSLLRANLLADPGFEAGTLASWTRQWYPGESGSLSTSTAARSGNFGAWIYTASGSSLMGFSSLSQKFAATPGQTYSGSAHIRTPVSQGWMAGSYACARIAFLSSSMNQLAIVESPRLTTSNSTYGSAFSATTGPAPVGTAWVEFQCYLYEPAGNSGQSVVNFDDTVLEMIVAPPVISTDRSVIGFGTDLASEALLIRNTGSGTLHWNITTDKPWLTVLTASGTTTTETDTVTLQVLRSSLNAPYEQATLAIASDGGSREITVFAESIMATVPTQPSLVSGSGSRLMVRRRLPNGSLDLARPYVIRGAAWSPAGVGSTSDPDQRRDLFATWYRTDVRLLKEMNANTVYVFLDPGTSGSRLQAGLRVLDALYRNGIMVVMTVDQDGSNIVPNIPLVVNAYRNHPAILMWALGNEWNLLRPDRSTYYGDHATLAQAAAAMQTNALSVKALDSNHPVCSILGEINQPSAAAVQDIVGTTCSAVDVWGANIYRGSEFFGLFSEWAGITSKPLFLSEFGADAFHATSWWPPIGYEDQPMQAARLATLWQDLAMELSANDPSRVCLGGTVFEFCDEWWKSSAGQVTTHESDGFETYWNPQSQPDGFANEEWFGLTGVDRSRRQAYFAMQTLFAAPLKPFAATPVFQDGSLFLSFPSETGRRYTLEESTNLKNWSASSVPAIDATATEISFSFPKPAAMSRFYRIKLNP